MKNKDNTPIFLAGLVLGSFIAWIVTCAVCESYRTVPEPTNVSKALEREQLEALPEGIIPIQIGLHFARKINCPICDKIARVYNIEKWSGKWSFAYYCGQHHIRYDENMHLESIR